MDQPPSDSAAALENLRAALKELETAAVGYHVRRRLDAPPSEPLDMSNVPEQSSPVVVPPPLWRRALNRVRKIWRRLSRVQKIPN